MKVKDLERTANVAWSPKTQHPIYLAAGTAAQQLDASFNTNAALEIYALNLSEPGPDLALKSTRASEHRFHKIIWGAHGDGTIIAGCDGGLIQIYSASKLLKGDDSALIGQQEKHKGPVHALDFNPFQQNLFATGAGESEIFIWDLNHTGTPMSPGAKSQPSEDVLSVAWNRQVQHILASTFASKCVIWDLRKNEPIIKLTDTVSRVRWKVVAWHPEVATQLCLASEEDHSPIIQLWDLRFATSPLKTLENHQRGVLSVAWCADDSDLLVSCGKDNRIICWNPNSDKPNGEVLSEVAKTNQWSFDIAWCPRNPALIAAPNFDGHVSVFSLMGGQTQQIQTTNKIADSFPGMDGYVQAPVMQNTAPVSVDLAKAPKWLKKPVGASFGFGGKLITFETPSQSTNQDIPLQRSVEISQVITEPELVKKSNDLEQALEYGNFIEYCLNKAESTTDQHKKYIWHFLKANFEPNPRTELLNLLGYRIEDVNGKLGDVLGKDMRNLADGLVDQMNLNRLDDFDNLATQSPTNNKPITPFQIKTGNDTDGLIAQAILLNNVEAAVELCLNAKRFADALIIATTGGPDLLAKTQHKYLQQSNGYISALISAMVSEDWGSVINDCDISSWKEALAAALTHASDDDLPILCEQLGSRLENESRSNPKLSQEAQLCYICSGSFDKLVTSWSGNALSSTSSLQELVELITFLQKAVERQGRQVKVSGPLADVLSHYASLLASQGDLKTAISYLGSTQNEKVSALRERLYVSLGQKPAYVQELRQQQSRRASTRTSFTNFNSTNPFSTPQTQFNPVATQFPPAVPVNQFGVAAATPWQAQPPAKTFSPPPPPRPASASSNHGLPSRKYVLDPSVASNQYGIAPSRNQFVPPANVFQPSAVPNPSLNPMPLGGGGYGNVAPTPIERAQPPPPPPIMYSSNAACGWNDPPTCNKPNRPQPKQDLPTAEPIRHPLYGSAAPPDQFPPPTNGYGDVGGVPPPMQPFTPQPAYNPTQFYPPQTPPFNPNATNFAPSFNPGNFNQNAVQTAASTGIQQESRGVPEPVEKLPIPAEHVHIQTVLDELRNQCSCAANNPQTKRKLEDVGRKLETLYDMLREQRLSPNTLPQLHQLVQLVQKGDYTNGLHLHTQLVSGPDFAQIASFMPGLKVLLQCALQLQVYLR